MVIRRRSLVIVSFGIVISLEFLVFCLILKMCGGALRVFIVFFFF